MVSQQPETLEREVRCNTSPLSSSHPLIPASSVKHRGGGRGEPEKWKRERWQARSRHKDEKGKSLVHFICVLASFQGGRTLRDVSTLTPDNCEEVIPVSTVCLKESFSSVYL